MGAVPATRSVSRQSDVVAELAGIARGVDASTLSSSALAQHPFTVASSPKASASKDLPFDGVSCSDKQSRVLWNMEGNLIRGEGINLGTQVDPHSHSVTGRFTYYHTATYVWNRTETSLLSCPYFKKYDAKAIISLSAVTWIGRVLRRVAVKAPRRERFHLAGHITSFDATFHVFRFLRKTETKGIGREAANVSLVRPRRQSSVGSRTASRRSTRTRRSITATIYDGTSNVREGLASCPRSRSMGAVNANGMSIVPAACSLFLPGVKGTGCLSVLSFSGGLRSKRSFSSLRRRAALCDLAFANTRVKYAPGYLQWLPTQAQPRGDATQLGRLYHTERAPTSTTAQLHGMTRLEQWADLTCTRGKGQHARMDKDYGWSLCVLETLSFASFARRSGNVSAKAKWLVTPLVAMPPWPDGAGVAHGRERTGALPPFFVAFITEPSSPNLWETGVDNTDTDARSMYGCRRVYSHMRGPHPIADMAADNTSLVRARTSFIEYTEEEDVNCGKVVFVDSTVYPCLCLR
ncbi:hypothetical protein BC835DRAFT_1304727 [Cytidiella melzeri]|nr:hypothetical protein BC835DRAFT_1304727 [Cytidiella melzeri]